MPLKTKMVLYSDYFVLKLLFISKKNCFCVQAKKE